ncbi:MAG TPA: HIT domain-containing protein [Verrucomicrobiae bacterium]|nr:HIT domain-containing protein [Verrucomicrobiae bacterium]
MSFELHPRLGADTVELGDFALCRLLLMNDAQYPWFILVPRRAGAREIYQLDERDQQQLLKESAQLSRAIMDAYQGEKLNVAALGNLVPQLHIHHVVRFSHDAAWPRPVWGLHPGRPYGDAERATRLKALRATLTANFSWAGRLLE